jgi:hypothetical protein
MTAADRPALNTTALAPTRLARLGGDTTSVRTIAFNRSRCGSSAGYSAVDNGRPTYGPT